jgi:type IV pilus assembly protein PilA
MTTARPRSAITLWELGAVIAVTVIIAALGHSAYRTYRVRAQVNDGVVLASGLTSTIADSFRRRGEVPTKLPLADLQVSPFIESITVVDGRIDVLFGGQADLEIAGRRISLTPYETVERDVVWVCGNEKPGPGLEPLGFASGGWQSTHMPTTIEARYLSTRCR